MVLTFPCKNIEKKQLQWGSSTLFAILASFVALGEAGVVDRHYYNAISEIGTRESILPFLGGAGPHYSFPFDYGIPKEVPEACEMTQVQIFGRPR